MRIWRFFASLRLTIYLVIAMVVDALIGTFFLSEYQEELRRMDYVVFLPWLFTAGLDMIGLTWWVFLLLLLLLLFAINTLVCTIDSILDLVRQKQTGRMVTRRLLVQAVHLGFIIALLGHLLSGLSGFRSPDNYILEGETLEVPQEGLTIRLDRLDVAFSREGVMERMEADITLLRDGKDVKRKTIGPNRPMLYGSMAVYLTHHGAAPVGLEFRITGNGLVEEREISFAERTVRFKGYRLALGPFIPDFARDREGRPYSASGEFRNPAQRLDIYKGDDLITSGWLFFAHPSRFFLTFDEYTLSFSRILYRPYAVLEVNKDPGAIVALIGTLLFMSALIALLFVKGEGMELVPDLEG